MIIDYPLKAHYIFKSIFIVYYPLIFDHSSLVDFSIANISSYWSMINDHPTLVRSFSQLIGIIS